MIISAARPHQLHSQPRLISYCVTIAFLEERSFFFKLKAFAKDFEKYSCKPGEKGRYVNLDFGQLVELSKLDKALRSLVIDLALDIEHYLKVRINAAAMRAGTDPFKVVDTFLEGSAASVVSEQTKALDKSAGANALLLTFAMILDAWQRPKPRRHKMRHARIVCGNYCKGTISERADGLDR